MTSSRWEGARGLAAGLGRVEEAGWDGREVVVAGGQGLGWGAGGAGGGRVRVGMALLLCT